MRPRKVKRGSRILSDDHNSLVNALNKLGPKALGVLQGSVNSVYQRKNREVLGVVHIPVAADYTDAKYFVRLSHCDNITGDGITNPISFDDTGATLVTATNLAEILEDTHYLSNDTPVRMFWTWDRQSPKIRRYYFIMGPAGTLDNPYQLLPALGAWEANASQIDIIPDDVALDEDSYQFTIGRPVYDHTTTPPEFKYYMRTIKIPMMLGIEISAETVEDIDVIEPCDADVDGNSVTVQIARAAGAPAGGSLVSGEPYWDTTNFVGYLGDGAAVYYFGQYIPGVDGVDFIHNVDVNVDITSLPNVTNTPNWQWNQAGDSFKSSRGLMATHITATGTVQGEQITSTDDISAAGIYNLVATTATEGYLVQSGYRLFHTYEPTDQAASFSNIFIGEDAGNFGITNVAAAYLGTGNVGIGENSLNGLTTGYYNTAIGRRTGESITIGDRNVIMGYSSGLDLTDGIRNTLIGANVADDLDTGDSNTAVGYHSLYESVDGEGNVAVGANALSGTHAQSGDDTVSIGYYSGYKTYGDNCTFIGAYAGYQQTTMSDILLINNSAGALADIATELTDSLIYGTFAAHGDGPTFHVNGDFYVRDNVYLVTTTSTEGIINQNSIRFIHSFYPTDQATTRRNVFIGENSGNFTMTNVGGAHQGNANVGIGTKTLKSLTIGFYNVAIGHEAGENILGGYGNMLLGYQSGKNITSGEGNAGIGRSTLFEVTTGKWNTAVGRSSMQYGNGSLNTGIGRAALFGTSGQSGNRATAIGAYSGNFSYGDDCVFIGAYAGYRHTTQDDILIINAKSTAFADAATEITSSLIYGYFSDHASGPLLNINGDLSVKGEIEGGAATTKFKLTAIGGFAIRLTNKTGGASVAGQLIAPYSATAVDDAFKTAAANSDEVIGIVLDGGVADGSEVWIVVSGIADVLMDAGGSARGDRIISSATAGSADVWNTGGAVATHFQEIGHCIETRGGAGLAKCVLHFN